MNTIEVTTPPDLSAIPDLLKDWSGPVQIKTEVGWADGVVSIEGGVAFTDALLFGENAPNATGEVVRVNPERPEVRFLLASRLALGQPCGADHGALNPGVSCFKCDKGRINRHPMWWALDGVGPLTPAQSAFFLSCSTVRVAGGMPPLIGLVYSIDRLRETAWMVTDMEPCTVHWTKYRHATALEDGFAISEGGILRALLPAVGG